MYSILILKKNLKTTSTLKKVVQSCNLNIYLKYQFCKRHMHFEFKKILSNYSHCSLINILYTCNFGFFKERNIKSDIKHCNNEQFSTYIYNRNPFKYYFGN